LIEAIDSGRAPEFLKANLPIVFGLLDVLSVLPLVGEDLSLVIDNCTMMGAFVPYLQRSTPERQRIIERNRTWMTKYPNIKDILQGMLEKAKNGTL
jgi:hypothetical protein